MPDDAEDPKQFITEAFENQIEQAENKAEALSAKLESENGDWVPNRYLETVLGAGFVFDEAESSAGCIAFSKYLDDDTYMFVQFSRVNGPIEERPNAEMTGYRTGPEVSQYHSFEVRSGRLSSPVIMAQLNALHT